ncbi:MAG: hypothetical protein ABIO70_10685 [Pseudomonadota bacterium]
MAFQLNEEEYRLIAALPEEDLVDLAVELDIPVGEAIDRRDVLALCVRGLAQLAKREGLPFSEYDREDLESLPPTARDALARRLGVAPEVGAILKAGRKVYRTYTRQRPRSQVPLVLPSLLGPLCRFLAEGQHLEG